MLKNSNIFSNDSNESKKDKTIRDSIYDILVNKKFKEEPLLVFDKIRYLNDKLEEEYFCPMFVDYDSKILNIMLDEVNSYIYELNSPNEFKDKDIYLQAYKEYCQPLDSTNLVEEFEDIKSEYASLGDSSKDVAFMLVRIERFIRACVRVMKELELSREILVYVVKDCCKDYVYTEEIRAKREAELLDYKNKIDSIIGDRENKDEYILCDLWLTDYYTYLSDLLDKELEDFDKIDFKPEQYELAKKEYEQNPYDFSNLV